MEGATPKKEKEHIFWIPKNAYVSVKNEKTLFFRLHKIHHCWYLVPYTTIFLLGIKEWPEQLLAT